MPTSGNELVHFFTVDQFLSPDSLRSVVRSVVRSLVSSRELVRELGSWYVGMWVCQKAS